jgi:ankyrin repeat protein
MDAFEAIKANDMAALEKALAAGGADISGPDGATLLSFAAYNGKDDAIVAIRRHKPELSPYEAATLGERGQLAKALAGGWDANTLSPDGFSPLALACFFRREEVIDLLLQWTDDVNVRAKNPQQVAALHASSAARDNATVEKLLRAGADPNLPQQQGFRAIHTAGQHGDAVLAGLLLLFGADPAIRTDAGETAADFARKAGHDWLAQRLEGARR